ncbi:hypothetical protein L211DRAFT_644657 [Terfezia boudieri ATCC MYA-4762]|uniref:Uncharacterized protein n=1 Tax=Terfezia boudieri ATCC MYA-4762 TaxID=1051890 RepID=A0A3N4M130_9PEZI|nr:hypothetical protein L211DRAFT_644657 [Terfezia boudieri ATCC MYA-4762]
MSDDGDTPAPSRSPSPSRHSHDHNHNFHHSIHHTHTHDHTSPHHQHRQSSYISAPNPPSFAQFPHMPALFTTPPRAAFTYEDAARLHQQNLANHHEMLRRQYQQQQMQQMQQGMQMQQMQQGMHGFGTPQTLGPGLGPMQFLTMPGPPPPAIGLGNGVPMGGGSYSHSVSVSSASGGAGGDPVVRTSTSVRYGDNVVRSISLARPAPQQATQGPGHTQDPGSLSSSATVRAQVTVSTPASPSAPTPGPTPQASTRTPVFVHNSLPSPHSNGNTNTNVNVNINGLLFTSPGSTNTLGQAPADPHGVRTARLIPRPASQDYIPTTTHDSAPRHSPSVLGGPRMGSFLQEHRASQERMREARQITANARAYALARAQTATVNANRAHNAAFNAANLIETNRARLLLTNRINARRANTNTAAATTATVPTAGPLLTILIASLKDCLGYDAVSTFAKSNYPHLTDKCYAKPRFLCMSTRQNTGPPSPLTMDAVMERLITQHISAEELERLEVPDWEGYMLLALELKWLETGMVVVRNILG